jgi:ABC-type uncharacterized transport system YnjBCD substrate-binding protein
MFLAAQLAVGGRLRVVHTMLDWLGRVQESKYGLQIAIVEVLVNRDWHDRT